MKVLVDAAVHSELGKVIKCDFKLGSVERSLDIDKEGIPRQAIFKTLLLMKIEISDLIFDQDRSRNV
jgi:hypothetical protein